MLRKSNRALMISLAAIGITTGGSAGAESIREHQPHCEVTRLSRARHVRGKAECRLAEAAAQRLIDRLPLPEGTVEALPVPSLEVGTPRCSPWVDEARFWRSPGEPRVVVEWIEAHARGGLKVSGRSEEPGRRGEWFGEFEFAVREPNVESETLVFEGMPAKRGGTVLRADAEVIPEGALCIHHG